MNSQDHVSVLMESISIQQIKKHTYLYYNALCRVLQHLPALRTDKCSQNAYECLVITLFLFRTYSLVLSIPGSIYLTKAGAITWQYLISLRTG